MKTTNTIAEVKENHKKISKEVDGLKAFICLFKLSTRRQAYGVNYLKPETQKGFQYLTTGGGTQETVTVIEEL